MARMTCLSEIEQVEGDPILVELPFSPLCNTERSVVPSAAGAAIGCSEGFALDKGLGTGGALLIRTAS